MPCKHCHKQPARKPRTKRMKTSSAKAKGRRLQQFVRDELRKLAPQLDPTDIESTPMGVNGVDVVLTKAARAVFGELAIECKNVEILNAVGVFQGHCDKYQPKGKVPIMVHSRNHIDPRITMLWSDFVRLYLKSYLVHRATTATRDWTAATALSASYGLPCAACEAEGELCETHRRLEWLNGGSK